MTTRGVFTEFTIPTASPVPQGITQGPDGALWFCEGASNKIGRMTTSGAFTEFAIPTANSDPQAITQDGALWFVELIGNKIGRITTSGEFTEWAIPTANSHPYDIVQGPDSALYFTEYNGNNIHLDWHHH